MDFFVRCPTSLCNQPLKKDMSDTEFKKGAAYFAELSRRFARRHIESLPAEDDRLPVLLDGQKVGVVIPEGAMRIRKGWIDNPETRAMYPSGGKHCRRGAGIHDAHGYRSTAQSTEPH